MEQFLYSLLAGACGAFLVNLLEFRKFRSERWWELRNEAYGKLTNALFTLRLLYESHAKGEPSAWDTKSPYLAELIDKHAPNAYAELRKATGFGAYLICEEAVTLLTRLDAFVRQYEGQKLSPEERSKCYADLAEKHDQALRELCIIAKQDLRVRNRWLEDFEAKVSSGE